MGNKQNLQLNNEELQAALNTIKSLPSSQKWNGGGGTIVPGTSDITIPAYTDTELTVHGEPNFLAENIRADISMWGTTGTLIEGLNLSSLGITRFTTGTFIFNINPSTMYGDTELTAHISHNLGIIPKLIIVRTDAYTSQYCLEGGYVTSLLKPNGNIAGAIYSGYGTAEHCYRAAVTPETFALKNEIKSYDDVKFYKADTLYKWICIG